MRIYKNFRACLIIACAVFSLLAASRLAAQVTRQEPPVSDTGIGVQTSRQLFATLCALDAAGFDADESTLSELPARLALRGDLLKMQGPATVALRQFYREHSFADPAATLSRYVAFAVIAGPPPEFQLPADRDTLPPDVLALEGFQQVLADFYKEANLEKRWTGVEREYERAAENYEPVLRRAVTVTNGYLRELVKQSRGATFTVYVEPLAGSRTTFRNVGDRYWIVAGTGSQIPADDIQHAYIHFMLDPLVIKYRLDLQKKRDILNVAATAPRLPEEYRSDFIAFTDECLVKAVELRMRRMTAAQLESALHDYDVSGFTLVRPFVVQLQKFEKSEPSMTYYFADLIGGIDVSAEQKRLKGFVFADAQQPAPAQNSETSGNQPSDLDRMLAEGDRQIALQQGTAAAAVFGLALEKYPNDPRAMYGLAIASVLTGNADQATDLFRKLASETEPDPNRPKGPAPDPSISAWSHVYLGRIHDLQGDRDLAVKEYQVALNINGAPESARVAAQRGVDAAYNPPARATADSK